MGENNRRRRGVLWGVLLFIGAFLCGVLATVGGDIVLSALFQRDTRLVVLAELRIQDEEKKVVRLYGHRSPDMHCSVRFAALYQHDGATFQQMIPLQDFFDGYCRNVALLSRSDGADSRHDDLIIQSAKGQDVYSFDKTQMRYQYVRTNYDHRNET